MDTQVNASTGPERGIDTVGSASRRGEVYDTRFAGVFP